MTKVFIIGSLQVHVGSACLYDDQRGEIRIGPFDTTYAASTFAREHLREQLKELVTAGVLEPPPPRESPHIPATEEYEVLDFRKLGRGVLLRRSDFYARAAKHNDQNQIGILTDLSFFQDSKGRVHAYPMVRWEGSMGSTLTCPRLVELYREDATAPRIVIDNGQWGTHGPPTDS